MSELNPSTNLELLHRFLDGFQQRRPGVLDALVDPAFVDHHVPAEVGAGAEGVKAWWAYLWEALDISMRIDDLVVGPDRIAGRYTASGRLLVPYAGQPGDGRAFTVPIMAIERFADGRIVERWEVVDIANLRTGPPE